MIHSTTHLVLVNVIAEDKNGNPVVDLKRDDFTLTDKGQTQDIRLFSIETAREISPPEAAQPPNTFTNRLPCQNKLPGNVSVILLDGLSTEIRNWDLVRDQIIKFIDELRPEDCVAIYLLRNDLHILHDFTDERATLVRSVARYRADPSRKTQVSSDPKDKEIDDFLRTRFPPEAAHYPLKDMGRRVAALEMIMDHIAGMPGRKNLFWISHQYPINLQFDTDVFDSTKIRGSWHEVLDRAALGLSRSNLAIYPVEMGSADVNQPPWPFVTVPGFLARNMVEATGGRELGGPDTINRDIRRAMDESRVSYTLGYYPIHDQWNGDFRGIKVTTKRPGLKLQYRNGYFAIANKPPDDQKRRVILQEASWSPLDATAIGLTVREERPAPPVTNAVRLSVLADSRDVEFDQEGPDWAATLDLYFIEKAADGKPLKDDYRTLYMKLAEDRYRAVAQQGINIVKNLDVAAGAAQIRVLVRDNRSGKIGSVTVPLEEKPATKPS